MIGRLFVEGKELDLDGVTNFPISYSIADVKNPTQRKRSGSKTVVLQGTTNNLNFFSSAYRLNASDQYGTGIGFDFDPTLQYKCQYYKNNVPVFEGSMRLLRVVDNNGVYTFEISIFATSVSIDKRWGNLTVAELGWDAYDHALNQTNVQNSWTAATGSGYVYGLINYGLNGDPEASVFATNELIPHVYQWEILEKAFEYLGYTISSNTLNTADFKKRTWGTGDGNALNLDTTEIDNRESDLDYEHDYTGIVAQPSLIISNGLNYDFYYSGSNSEKITSIPFANYTINTDNYNQIGDYGGGSPDLDGIFTISNKGRYRLSFDCPAMNLNLSQFGGSVSRTLEAHYRFAIYKNGIVIKYSDEYINSTTSTSNTDIENISMEVDSDCEAGDIFELGLLVELGACIVSQLKASAPPSSHLDYTVTADADTTGQNATLNITCINKQLVDGETVQLARFMPKVTVSKWFNDLVTMYNLYVSEPDSEGVVSIENFNTYFYGTNFAEDWSDLLDRSQPIVIDPPLIKAKNYKFKFAQDAGFWETQYRDDYGKGYGDYNYELSSPLSTDTKEWNVHFAQSLPVQIRDADGSNPALIMPCIYQIDKETTDARPYKGKPRVFYYNGLNDCVDWGLTDSDGLNLITLNEYPQFHHLNDIETPTFDLNFGKPDWLYYVTTDYTNSNIVQEYYVEFLTEITDKSAKTINAWFNLSEENVGFETLRYLVNIDGVIYRKNIIKDFDGKENRTTLVELNRVVQGRKPNTAGLGTPTTPNDGEIESILNNGNDYHSGFNTIASNKTITIKENKQMTVSGQLTVNGTLVIDGGLVINR